MRLPISPNQSSFEVIQGKMASWRNGPTDQGCKECVNRERTCNFCGLDLIGCKEGGECRSCQEREIANNRAAAIEQRERESALRRDEEEARQRAALHRALHEHLTLEALGQVRPPPGQPALVHRPPTASTLGQSEAASFAYGPETDMATLYCNHM